MKQLRHLSASLAFLLTLCGSAQVGEQLLPLRSMPVPGVLPPLRTGVNNWFIYEYLPQQLPVIDDFSVDRTRKRNARPGDADVTFDQTVYHLEVAGASTPDMRFSADTTWSYLVDTTDPDNIIITSTFNPPVQVTVRDITVFPSPAQVVECFPAYTIFDTVGTTTPDTLGISADYVQDSLLVYIVAADPRLYYFPDGTTRPLILWEDDNVFINGTYPVDPPTQGVATFEGLDRTGIPYNNSPSSHGIADLLTSVPINLQWPAGDSIYLSFFHQPVGLSGDGTVQPIDSLILEFYAPADDEWVRVWRKPYTALAPFQQVLIPIKENRFLQNGFRMRFLNYATLAGALDHWHIDYVRIGRQRAYNDTTLVDVGYLYPESTLLQTYTSVPYKKFRDNPSSYMALTASPLMKNLNQDRFITYGMRAGFREDPLSAYTDFPTNGANIGGNAFSTFPVTHPLNSAPNNFIFPAPLADSANFYRVQYYSNVTPDINRYNDTLTFVQEISNFYAYDDGSAEAGYNLNVNGAKLAVRFDTQGQDSLRAVRAYFSPILAENDPTTGSFIITIWTSLNPEVVLHQNFSFSSPEYLPWGLNHFIELPLDSVVPVSGTFYVGWVQTSGIKMNVGFDRNRDNSNKLYYKTGASFVNTSFPGSLMLRPVVVADKDPYAGMGDAAVHEQAIRVYPNPATDRIVVDAGTAAAPGQQVLLVDALGRTVLEQPLGNGTIVLSDLTDGLYTVVLVDLDGRRVGAARAMIRR
ncbi:MAG: T9SS type A sorting domain-containing protein [Flavobacteriales bacterium]|nr:T9SS type A sorting domain-containing protein [Flavobacteriales bacterium]